MRKKVIFITLFLVTKISADQWNLNGWPFNLPDYYFCGTCNLSTLSYDHHPINELDEQCRIYNQELLNLNNEYFAMRDFLENVYSIGKPYATNLFWLFYSAARSKIIFESIFLKLYSLRLFVKSVPLGNSENCLIILSEGTGFQTFRNVTTHPQSNRKGYNVGSFSDGIEYEDMWTAGIEHIWASKVCDTKYHSAYVAHAVQSLTKMEKLSKDMHYKSWYVDYWKYWTADSYSGYPTFTDVPHSNLPTCLANPKFDVDMQPTTLYEYVTGSPFSSATPTPNSNRKTTPVPSPIDSIRDQTADLSTSSTASYSPWGDSCYIIINEYSTYLRHFGTRPEFLELRRVCTDSKNNRNLLGLRNVKVVIMNLVTKEIVVVINLNNFSFEKHTNLFTLRDDEAHKKFIHLAHSTFDHKILPSGFKDPHAIFILHKSGSGPFIEKEGLTNLAFKRVTRPAPIRVFENMEVKIAGTVEMTTPAKIIKSTLIDASIYGNSINQDFSFLKTEISSRFVGCNFILHEVDPNNEAEIAFTINQCGPEHPAPYQFKMFKRGSPSPGSLNDCRRTSFILDILEHVVINLGAFQSVGVTETPFDVEDCPVDDSIIGETLNAIDFEVKYIIKHLNPKFVSAFLPALEVGANAWKYLSEKKVDLDVCTVKERLYPFEVIVSSNIEEQKTLRCILCNKRLNSCPKTFKKPFDDLVKDSGWIGTNTETVHKKITRHVHKSSHLRSVLQLIRQHRIHLQAGKDRDDLPVPHLADRLKALANVFRAAYTLILSNTTPFQFEKIMKLLYLSDANIGQYMTSRWTAMRILTFMSDVMHQQLVDFLLEQNHPLSIMLDGSSDRQNHHFIMVFLQTTEGSRTITYFYRMLILGKSSKAVDYMDVLIKAFEKDGNAFVVYIKRRVTSVATDGAANMILFQKKFDIWVDKKDINNQLIPRFGVFCVAHKLQLTTRSTVNPPKKDKIPLTNPLMYLQEFETELSTFYNFFKSASRRIGLFRDIQTSLDFPRVELTYLYTNRWISAEYRAIKNFLESYQTLVQALTEIALNKDGEFDKKTQELALNMLKTLTDKRFVIIAHSMQDYTKMFRVWSLGLQHRGGILVSQHEYLERLERNLLAFDAPNFDSKSLQAYLAECYCSAAEDVRSIGCTLEEYENSEEINWNGVKLKTSDSNIPLLSALTPEIIKQTRKKLSEYIPREDIMNLKVFHSNHFPSSIEALTTQYPEMHADGGDLVYAYGSIEIRILAKKLGMPSINILITNWAKLVKSMVLSPKWSVYRSVNDPGQFWYLVLEDKSLAWSDDTDMLVRKVLTIVNGSIICETAFSLFNVIKNQRRTRISNDHLEAFIRLASNGPKSLDHFDAGRYAQLWDDAGKSRPEETPIFDRTKDTVDEITEACEEIDDSLDVEDLDITLDQVPFEMPSPTVLDAPISLPDPSIHNSEDEISSISSWGSQYFGLVGRGSVDSSTKEPTDEDDNFSKESERHKKIVKPFISSLF